MKRLTRLRSRLKRLLRRRRILRFGSALGALALAALWLLSTAFLVDWTFEMDRTQRVVSLVLLGGAFLWTTKRYVQPLLGKRETILDMALLVEKEQGIDSDLIAALEFEGREAGKWGSPQLEEAVIDQVADLERDLDVFRGLSSAEVARRAGLLFATATAIGCAALVFPGHAGAFLDRLLLGSAHYPTRTRIERILVNGEVPRGVVRCAYGRPVRFEVTGAGDLPVSGTVTLEARERGGVSRTAIDLQPAAQPPAETARTGERLYAGGLERLLVPLTYSLRLGDAWTDAAPLEVIPLPLACIELRPVPPPYARGARKGDETPRGALQASVVEGSRVGLSLTCANKSLRAAILSIGGEPHELQSVAADRRRWELPVDGTPLARVTAPIRFEVRVVDDDGLSPEAPLEGSIHIRADREPRVAATMVTPNVLPAARPSIAYGATDDFGVASIVALVQVSRGGDVRERESRPVFELPAGREPDAVRRGRYALDLASLELRKGDEVTVVIEATDFRGELPGKSASSDPLVFHVTDERGVLAAMLDSDERSARQLDAIIERQLGIGESK